jgi:hypothetical protein
MCKALIIPTSEVAFISTTYRWSFDYFHLCVKPWLFLPICCALIIPTYMLRLDMLPLCVPQMYGFVVPFCFGDTFVSIVVFSPTFSILHFASNFYFFYLPPPFPGSHVPFPSALWLNWPIIQYFNCFLWFTY